MLFNSFVFKAKEFSRKSLLFVGENVRSIGNTLVFWHRELEVLAELPDPTPGADDNATVDGELYGVPFHNSTPLLYYNVEHFKEAGLDGQLIKATKLEEIAKK